MCPLLRATVTVTDLLVPAQGEADAALGKVPRQRAYIGLGGNLGDVQSHFVSALNGIQACSATRIEAVSVLYRTRPVESSGPDYLNAVAAIQSALGPRELLGILQNLEQAHDRERPFHNAPRTLDLDLLSYGGLCMRHPVLTLPHPRMTQRAFVLAPLAELMAQLKDAGDAVLQLPSPSIQAQLAKEQGIERLGAFFNPNP